MSIKPLLMVPLCFGLLSCDFSNPLGDPIYRAEPILEEGNEIRELTLRGEVGYGFDEMAAEELASLGMRRRAVYDVWRAKGRKPLAEGTPLHKFFPAVYQFGGNKNGNDKN